MPYKVSMKPGIVQNVEGTIKRMTSAYGIES